MEKQCIDAGNRQEKLDKDGARTGMEPDLLNTNQNQATILQHVPDIIPVMVWTRAVPTLNRNQTG